MLNFVDILLYQMLCLVFVLQRKILMCFFVDVMHLVRVGSELVYHRLPWGEPDAPFLLEVLYEDDDMVSVSNGYSLLL